MVQSKISGAINFVLVFTLLIGLFGRVSAHGILLSPTPRLLYGQNATDVIAKVSNPTKEFPCGIAGDSPGPVTTYKPGLLTELYLYIVVLKLLSRAGKLLILIQAKLQRTTLQGKDLEISNVVAAPACLKGLNVNEII
ncbi:hypothetical protein RhiirA5_383670 [Rhizophagus irregularis]|uniref:Uncharacterized protein n=1 Tax=Rhizophagus irregularis TaxID=588596 RepID=A0A2N0NW30_9GLOM|nr:hypothetical protein RhiirA5_383670 [Rhizophagus irregularis]